jgi:hypothetical protein
MHEMEILQIGMRKARESWREREDEKAVNPEKGALYTEEGEDVTDTFWSAHVRDGDRLWDRLVAMSGYDMTEES